jgi:hypothetical protein
MGVAIVDLKRRARHRIAGVAAGRHLAKPFEGWIVATPDRRKFAMRITSYPELDISVPFEWNATCSRGDRACARGDGRLTLAGCP